MLEKLRHYMCLLLIVVAKAGFLCLATGPLTQLSLFAVERRRRFNINDRIKELGTLIPKSNDP